MKQAIAIGAKRMISEMSRIETWKMPSIADWSALADLVWVISRPMPNINANTITARMSLSAAAATTLLGMMASTAETPCGLSDWPDRIAPAPSRASARRRWASAGSTPAPGWIQLVKAKAMTTAMPDTITVNIKVRRPTRFNARTSPISAIPTTSAENSKGMTSMNSKRRKIWPIGPVM